MSAFGRRLREEAGQVLPMTALLMVVLVGFAGLVIDVGRVWIAQRQLQNAVDATALSIAQKMPDDFAGWSTVPNFDGVSPSKNHLFGFGVTADNPTVQFFCSANAPGYKSGQCPQDSSAQDTTTPCQPGTSMAPQPAGVGCNAVTVAESAHVKSTFAGVFGFGSFNLSASGTASAPDQTITPIDLALVIDTTGSMGQGAPSSATVCPGIRNPSKLDCAKAGVKSLLQTLYPCNPGSPCGGLNTPLDKVELLIFPGLTNTNLRGREEDCTQNMPANGKAYDDPQNRAVNPFTSEGYTFTVVPFESSFSDWSAGQNKFVLNANDPLVEAMGTGNCGLESGGDTSYTSVLQTAQDSLNALGNDGATHAMVVLGDGEANYGPIYTSPNEPPPSAERHTPCQQAVNVADGATTAGTTIYTIGYWSPGSDQDTQCSGMNGTNACPYRSVNQFGCNEISLGNPARPWPGGSNCPGNFAASPIRGCWTMYYMASTPADFFPDASDTSLTSIFQQIAQNLGKTRLISAP